MKKLLDKNYCRIFFSIIHVSHYCSKYVISHQVRSLHASESNVKIGVHEKKKKKESFLSAYCWRITCESGSH